MPNRRRPSRAPRAPRARRRTRRLAALVPLALLAATPVLAVGLPENYHARFDPGFEAGATGSGAPTLRAELSAVEVAAERSLAAAVPDLRVARDERSLLPVSVLSYAPGVFLARAGSDGVASGPEAAARAFLAGHRDLFGVSAEDLGTLSLVYVTQPEGGATIARFEQIVDGVLVFDTELAVVMTRGLDVAAVAGRVWPGVAQGVSALGRSALSREEATVRALADLTGRAVAAADFVAGAADRDGYSYLAYAPDAAAAPEARWLGEEVRVRPVLFPLAAGSFVAGYYLELWVEGEPGGSGPVYAYVLSAEDGRLLFRRNLTQSDSFSYRTYAQGSGDYRPWDGPTGTVGTPHPTGTPDGYQAPFLNPAPLISIESLLGPTDPWLPAGATVTTGNNTDAYLDLSSPNGFSAGDQRGAITTPGVFDHQYDSTQNVEVAVNRQAAVVGMFYQVNWQHDFWYQHGFNEVSRNAQTNNYGRGGIGNDNLLAEGQDYSGLDNANMSTPADGSHPRMQMYKFTAGGQLNPNRDGTFDMLIVGHELMHYMSNRLVGNASGLTNRQGGSMGEGWGDFNCILAITQDDDDVFGTTYAIGGQTDRYWCGAGFNDNYYFSIRRYPYSSNKLKNPLTFKDIGPGITTYPGVIGTPCFSLTSSPSEVHNAGEIWANTLWQGFEGLARIHGVATARRKIMQYVVDGMKATPNQPTYTQARDGILAAVNAANGWADPSDMALLWKSFAVRGMGPAAVSPPSSSTSHAGVVEDFDYFAFWDGFESGDLRYWLLTPE